MEEQICQGRLKQFTASRYAAPIPSVSPEERYVLAWNQAVEEADKGKDAKEVRKKGIKKGRRKRRKAWKQHTGSVQAGTEQTNPAPKTHPVYFNNTDIRPASVLQPTMKHRKETS